MQKADRALLQEAFESFHRTSLELQRYYRSLEEQVRELAFELEQSRRQRERMAGLLEGVLESLSAGVIVLEDEKAIPLNRAAEELLGLKKGEPVDLKAIPSEWLEGEGIRSFGPRTFKVTPSPLREGRGRVIVVEDVTEVEKWRQQALRGEGLSAMEEVAAQLAHQVRNPLGVIKLFASLLWRELAEDERRGLAEHVIKGVEEIEGVISRLLLFVRPQHPDLKPIDLREPLKDVLSFVSRLLSENGIDLKTSLPSGPLPIRGDGELLKQVFYNLLLNAVEAMPEGGTLRVEALRSPSRLKGEVAEVVVADTGCGIPPETIREIFKPFYTTKQRGTGIGLTLAHRVIEAHGGLIEVESQPGKGTTFRISIPLETVETKSGGDHEGT